jgi:hypothetical protein
MIRSVQLAGGWEGVVYMILAAQHATPSSGRLYKYISIQIYVLLSK